MQTPAKSHSKAKWFILILVLLNGGWMAFDGMTALVTGDYVTPSSGEHAGRLGPWHHVVQWAGVDPRSTLMKFVFVVYGAFYLLLAAGFTFGLTPKSGPLLLTAALGCWYLPFGTLINLIVIAILIKTGGGNGNRI